MNKLILIGLVLLFIPVSVFALDNGNILAYYSFDAGVFSDDSGNSNNVTTSGIDFVNGGLNKYIQCDVGSSGTGSLNVDGDFSVSYWRQFNDTSGTQILFRVHENGATDHQLTSFLTTSDEIFRIQETGSSDRATVNAQFPGADNGFSHVMITVNDATNTMYVYLNGTLKGSNTAGSNFDFGSTSLLSFFCKQFSGGSEYIGGLDEFFFYDGLLSPGDAAALYNSGTIWNVLTGNGSGPGATVTLNYPANMHLTGNTTPVFGYTPDDNSSTISSCDLYTNTTGSWQSLVNDNTITAGALNTIQATTLSSQTLLWGIKCTYDGTPVFSGNRTLIIDTANPVITLTSPANQWYKTTAPARLDFEASDDQASALNCTLRVDGNTRATTTPNVDTNTSYVLGAPDTNEGNHTWVVNCTDNADNMGTASRWYTKDATAPTVAANYPLNDDVQGQGTITFSVNITEALSPNVTCDLYINGSLNKSVGFTPGNGKTTQLYMQQGSYYWWMDCRDKANNNGTSTIQYFNITTPSEEKLTIRNGVQFRTYVCSGVTTADTCNAVYTMQANYTNLTEIEITNNEITFEDPYMKLELSQNPSSLTQYNLTNVVFNTIDNLTLSTISNWSMNAEYDRVTATYTGAPYGAAGLFVSGFIYAYTATQPSYVDAVGYFSPVNLSDIITIDFLETGKLRVNVYNVETGELLYQNTSIRFEDDDSQTTYTVNGTALLSNLTLNTEYDVRIESLNFDTAFYTFTYDINHVQLDAYLNPNGTAITFNVINSLKNPLQDATVTVYRFVNGTNTLIGTIKTEITGDAVFILNTSDSHTITVSKSGYQTQTFKLSTITQSEYTIQLRQSTGVEIDSAFSKVAYNYTPTNGSLPLNVVRFAFEISATQNDLNYFGLTIYNGSDEIGKHNISYLDGGGVAFKNINLSAYNQSKITALFYYQREGFDTVYFEHSYYVTDRENYIGSLLQFRDYMKKNVDVIMRIVLWAFSILIFALVLGSVVRGVANAAITIIFGLGLAWVFSLNMVLVGLVCFVLALGFISANRGEFT